MGLIDATEVPPLHRYDDDVQLPHLKCMADEPVIAEEIVRTVTIEEIEALHGERVPGPDLARRSFSIGFLAESHNRLLTSTEMTFYDIFAAHYASDVPAGDPDPTLTRLNWSPVTRFFGEGTKWCSDIPVGGAQLGFDINQDALVDIADVVGLLFSLFVGGDERLPCGGQSTDPGNLHLIDWNDDKNYDFTDAVSALTWMFLSGAPHALFVDGRPNCRTVVGYRDRCSTND